ncbi:family 4 carbohydrate esterase [Phakopsora pachyrhizi]|uniref:chitin deacetylase n=1 Tax=Phakopsora pachyrhizi TaxID=170000 RepID=A0AAV0B0S5_PHAPC|nr:family 4 carbohydrate esterase [Phakopsora pachyrhizi]
MDDERLIVDKAMSDGLKESRISLTLVSSVLIIISCWIYFGSKPQLSSPAIRLSDELSKTFPGTPKDEVDAMIDWNDRNIRSDRRVSGITYSFPPYSTISTPAVGSHAWFSLYPEPTRIGPRPRTQWIRRLNWLIKQADLDRNHQLLNSLRTPKSRLNRDGLVSYRDEVKLGKGKDGICSWERTGCLKNSENGYNQHQDIIDTDPMTWVINFDDGPLPPSEALYRVLDQRNLKATHFWIGGNVLRYWDLALIANRRGDHLAVHTWSHSHLTSLSNEEVLGELGWCIQIIFDLTGKVPRYFRPPYGNIDNRIRDIARHVFGLETVIWNFDSVDWGLNQTYSTGDQVDPADQSSTQNSIENVVLSIKEIIRKDEQRYRDYRKQIIKGEKNSSRDQDEVERMLKAGIKGRLILEHELSFESVEVFNRSLRFLIDPRGETNSREQDENLKDEKFDHSFRTGCLPECILNRNSGKEIWYQ